MKWVWLAMPIPQLATPTGMDHVKHGQTLHTSLKGGLYPMAIGVPLMGTHHVSLLLEHAVLTYCHS